jgi:hypothetical protein
MYSKEFKNLVESELTKNSFIGFGNPNTKILIVGKEVSTNPNSEEEIHKKGIELYNNNVNVWSDNIKNNLNQNDKLDFFNPLYFIKGEIKKNVSNTWKNYQKLFDVIFHNEIDIDNKKIIEFQKEFFITEMSDLPSPKTGDAQKNENFNTKLENRKNTFFKSDFIQNFPVVVLACSNYIWNKENDWQINDIFGVTYDLNQKYSKGVYEFSNTNKFWTHYNDNGKKLVIHTRQLSNNVRNDMLIEMGKLINQHLKNI